MNMRKNEKICKNNKKKRRKIGKGIIMINNNKKQPKYRYTERSFDGG